MSISAPIEAPVFSPIGGSMFAPGGSGDTIFYAPLINSLLPSIAGGSRVSTFTRALAAYYFDSETDLLVKALANAARFEDAGYLNEASSSNLLLSSEDMDLSTTPWTTTSTITTVQNDAVAPDGTTTATKVIDDNVVSAELLEQARAEAYGTGVKYTFSVFIKKKAEEQVYPALIVLFGGGTGKTYSVLLNTNTGETKDQQPGGYDVITDHGAEDVGDYWRLWAVCLSGTSNSSALFRLSPAAVGSATAWGDITAGQAFEGATMGFQHTWGAGMEENSFVTSPITTLAAEVTRPTDLLTYPVADNLLVNGVSIIMEYTPQASAPDFATDMLFGSRVDASNQLNLQVSTSTLTFRKKIAGVNYDATISLPYVKGTTYKIGARISPVHGVDVWVDKVKGVGDANTDDAVLSANFGIGSDDAGINPSTAGFKIFKVLKEQTDAQMGALT